MSTEFSEADLANLGRALMLAIEAHVPGSWHPAECPSEIVGDLVEELGELRIEAERARELREQVEKLTKERDEYKSGFEAAASKYRNLKLQIQEIINVC